MRATSAILLCAILGVASGWSVCSPRKIIRKTIRKSFERGFRRGVFVGAAAAGGAAVVAGAGAVGAAVAINQLNNGREVYEPAPGSMADRVVVVTGGSSGLGLETAKRLAAAGASVVLTSRTGAKGARAADAVRDYLLGKGLEGSNVYSLALNLDDLSDVKKFAASYEELGLGQISVLVNNAGVMAVPERELTVDGFERQFQSNHLGHFVLTSELFPYLSREGARVISVSSSASNIPGPRGLDPDNLNGEKSYGAWPAYGASKLANVLFTRELQKRADDAGLEWLTAATLHPGVVNTDLWRYIVGEDRLKEMKEKSDDGAFSLESLALSASSFFTLTPEQGASTQIFLAAAEDISKGAFYEDMMEKEKLPDFVTDEGKARGLWEASEEMGGVTFDLSATPEIVDAVTEKENGVVENPVEESAESPDAGEAAEDEE